MATIHLHNLTLGYERHPAVHHLSGTFAEGRMTAVVGPNGAGKTTLFKGIMGQLRALEGRVDLQGVKRREIGYLPQQSELEAAFPISVLDTVCLGQWRQAGLFRRWRQQAARQALERVTLAGFEQRPIGTLSRGQLQRVLFARLLVQDASVILLDEPFTAMDACTTSALLDLVLEWQQEGRTIIAILHDLEQVRIHCPATLILARNPVAWGDTAAVLNAENMQRTQRMSEAWDENAPLCEGLTETVK